MNKDKLTICDAMELAEDFNEGAYWAFLYEHGYDGNDVVSHHQEDNCPIHPKSDLKKID